MWGRALARAALAVALVAGVLSAGGAPAQQAGRTEPSAVLTVDPERLFQESAFGRRIIAESEAAAEALQAENRRIEAELTAEEKSLTERRPGLPVDEFHKLADAFNEKVDRIRAEQDGKAREIQEIRDAGQQEFFNRIGQVLLSLVIERRAAVLLDRRAVFLSAESVDVTDAAIARIDAEIGAGEEEGQDGAPPEGAADGGN